jgi:hypothetical protein
LKGARLFTGEYLKLSERNFVNWVANERTCVIYDNIGKYGERENTRRGWSLKVR